MSEQDYPFLKKQGRPAFKSARAAEASRKKAVSSIRRAAAITPLEEARRNLLRHGIRFENSMDVGDLSYLEAFIREVVKDERGRR